MIDTDGICSYKSNYHTITSQRHGPSLIMQWQNYEIENLDIYLSAHDVFLE